MKNANDVQHGGTHYKHGGDYQIWDYIEDVGLGYLEGNAVKYIGRWRFKNGVEDLRKAQHYIHKLMEIDRDNRVYNSSSYDMFQKLQQFQKSMQLTDEEAALIWSITRWSCYEDLMMVSTKLKVMIEGGQRAEST